MSLVRDFSNNYLNFFYMFTESVKYFSIYYSFSFSSIAYLILLGVIKFPNL